MMLKIGFIDYYLDEWHANNYPDWILQESGGELAVAFAWGEIDHPAGGMTNADWAKRHGVQLCQTQEELIEKSDVLCVLAPDNPETHERLSEKALRSGKITYIDKTFAPDLATAKRIFALADANKTPCMTTSALRYAEEYEQLDRQGMVSAVSIGGGYPDIYMIHQIEPLVMLFGTAIRRVRNVGTVEIPVFTMEYADKNRVTFACCKAQCPFQMTVNYNDSRCKVVPIQSDFFRNFIRNLILFYKTGEVLILHEQSLAVMAVREACIRAKNTPDEWVCL